MKRLWLIPLGGALLAPLVTWLPMLVARFSWIPLPPYQPAPEGIDVWHSQVFYLVIFCIVAALVGAQDRWLGVAILMIGLTIFLWGGTFDLTHSVFFMLGALALWAMRHMPQVYRPLVIACLAAAGVFQAVYVLHQMFGYDVLWIDIWGLSTPPGVRLRALGTLGTEDAAACYIAITAPLMPVWALPLAGAAVLKGNPEGHSITAVLALLVGLMVRYHAWMPLPIVRGALTRRFIVTPITRWHDTVYEYHRIEKVEYRWALTATLLLLIADACITVFDRVQHWHMPMTFWGRLQVWQLGVEDWWRTYTLPNIWTPANPVTGNGEWWPRVAILQKQLGRLMTGESFQQAHNDWLQWGYSYGVLGLTILGLWLWEHRPMFLDKPVGASLVALAIAAFGFFPFHVVSLSLLAICLIALASPVTESLEEVA